MDSLSRASRLSYQDYHFNEKWTEIIVNELKIKANQGDAKAQLKLGNYYFNLIDFSFNNKDALIRASSQYFGVASRTDSLFEMRNLFHNPQEKIAIEVIHYEELASRYHRLALINPSSSQSIKADAAFNLGKIYANKYPRLDEPIANIILGQAIDYFQIALGNEHSSALQELIELRPYYLKY